MTMVPIALLFITLGVPLYAKNVETTRDGASITNELEDVVVGGNRLLVFDVGSGIQLNCSSDHITLPPGTSYTWKKNGIEIDQIEELKGRYEMLEGGAVLRVNARTHEDDHGRYTCYAMTSIYIYVGVSTCHVQARPVAKLLANVNVVEGQKLNVTCKLVGKPYPPVQWMYAPANDNVTKAPVKSVFGARVSVHDSRAGVPGGELVLTQVEHADAGNYSCVPQGGVEAYTIVRVKGMYDALWPFIGICAEIFTRIVILFGNITKIQPKLEDGDYY